MKRLLLAILLCTWPQAAWSAGPFIYLAQTENYCAGLSGNIYYLYVYSPDDADFSGVSFDLDISGTVSATPFISVDAGSGVILQAVDTSSLPYHIELGWTPRTLMHELVATLLFSAPPVWDLGPKTVNVIFIRPGGETVAALDFQTYPGYPGGCNNCYLCFRIENRIPLQAGQATTIPFEWVFRCYSPGGLNIVVTDTQGWVTSWNPTGGTGRVLSRVFCRVFSGHDRSYRTAGHAHRSYQLAATRRQPQWILMPRHGDARGDGIGSGRTDDVERDQGIVPLEFSSIHLRIEEIIKASKTVLHKNGLPLSPFREARHIPSS